MPATKHGQERNRRQVIEYGEAVELVNQTTGEPVYSGPLASGSTPVSERFCSSCGKWQPQRGILAVVFGCPDCGRDW